MTFKQSSIQTAVLYLLSYITFMSGTCLANSSTIENQMKSDKTRWTSAFNVESSPAEINIHISVSLLIPNNVTRPRLDKQKILWQQSIDNIWNNRFYIQNKNITLPIKINVKFTHFKPHHKVIIHTGNWIPNQHNWYMNIPPNLVAHEVGHMLGAFDEYRGGTLAPSNPIIDTTSIMGSKAQQGVAYPRHLKLLETYLSKQLNIKQLTIKSY